MLFYITFVLSYTVFSSYTFYNDVIIEKNSELRLTNLDKYTNSLLIVFKNVFIYSIPIFLFIHYFYIPSNFSVLRSLLIIIVSKYISNILFYLSHMYSHKNKFLFQYHRVHHYYTVPIGMRSAYTHPIDFIFFNMIPLGITPFILGADSVTIVFIIISGIHNTIVKEHSYIEEDNHHMIHHKYSNCNYGEVWLDKLMGTYRAE